MQRPPILKPEVDDRASQLPRSVPVGPVSLREGNRWIYSGVVDLAPNELIYGALGSPGFAAPQEMQNLDGVRQ